MTLRTHSGLSSGLARSVQTATYPEGEACERCVEIAREDGWAGSFFRWRHSGPWSLWHVAMP